MQIALTIIMDGLIDASWIFIVAVGLTLTLGVLHILNLAHGNFYAIGAYLSATAVGWYYSGARSAMLGLLVMLGAALVVAVAMGPLLERLLFRRLYRSEESVVLLVTYALSLILEDATKLIWGANPYFAYEPYSLFGNVSIGGLSYVGTTIFLIALAVVVGVLLWFGLNRTKSGKLVLAVIYDREMSSSIGIDVQLVFVVAFHDRHFSGGAWRRVYGAQDLGSAGPLGDGRAVQFRGLSSSAASAASKGAAIAAVIVGLARSLAIHLAPWAEMFIIYLVLACVAGGSTAGHFRPRGVTEDIDARGSQEHVVRLGDACRACHCRPGFARLVRVPADYRLCKGADRVGARHSAAQRPDVFWPGPVLLCGRVWRGLLMLWGGVRDVVILVAAGGLLALAIGLVIAPLLASYRGIFFATLTLALRCCSMARSPRSMYSAEPTV